MTYKGIYEQAEMFHRVANEIIPNDWLDNENDDGHWFIPAIVNMSFACELYLKSLIVSDAIIKKHFLGELYDMLQPEVRNEILNSTYFKGDEDFLEELEEHSRTFENWRYCYERPCYVNFVFLERLAYVLHDVAVKYVQEMEQ